MKPLWRYRFILVPSLLVTLLQAQEPTDDLSALLDEVSDIATKNSLNVDYMPSVVTVINAEKFRDAGISNLAQVLEMLPGFQIQHTTIGYTTTTVRGFKNPNAYLSDKIKILIDGIPVHYETSGSSHFFLDFPLELVKKIEVLRGPASSLYGAGSLYGTINIITKLGSGMKQNRLQLKTGSFKYASAGGNVYTSIGDWSFYADGYYQQNDKKFYALRKGKRGDYVDESMQDYSLGFRLENENWEFLTRLKTNDTGNSYSFEGTFNPIEGRDMGRHGSTFLLSRLGYKSNISDIHFKTTATFSHRNVSFDANILSIGKVDKRFKEIGIYGMREGLYIEEEAEENNFDFESVATFEDYHSNNLLAGIGVQYTVVSSDKYYNNVEAYIEANLDTITSQPNYADFDFNEINEPAYWGNKTAKKLQDGTNRTNVYAYLQDLITLSDAFDLTLGIRADNYSDFGFELSKRAALVYRASEISIFKLLYGSAFRAPSFIESYANGHINYRQGNENLKPEETNTYEAVAIYKPNFHHHLMINYFYSVLDNVIDLEEDHLTPEGYDNYGTRVSQGVELEYNYKSRERHDLYFNATYIDTEYSLVTDTQDIMSDMPDISKVMLKGLYIFRPSNRLSFGTVWRYIGETTKTPLDWVSNDSTVDHYHVFDETVTFKLSQRSHIRLSIKNIFNADVKEPSYYYRTSGGVSREGSEIFASYEVTF